MLQFIAKKIIIVHEKNNAEIRQNNVLSHSVMGLEVGPGAVTMFAELEASKAARIIGV